MNDNYIHRSSTPDPFTPFFSKGLIAPLNINLNDFRDYVFADDLDDHARIAIQHAGMKPTVLKHMHRVLDEYGLAERFQAIVNSLSNGTPLKKARVLDFGCGEGLFLHDFAELLEERGLINGVELNGIDKNSTAIATAEEYARLSRPPRPFLNFYEHDGLLPLEECALLGREGYPNGPVSFDFIFAIAVMDHLSDARTHVEKLYQSLTPGGVIYLYNCDLERTHDQFGYFHPTLKFFGQAVSKMIMSVNPGVPVARRQAEWLRELGAEQVQDNDIRNTVGGNTEYGRWLLKDMIMVARSTGRILMQRGMLTQARFDQMIGDLYSELTADEQGYAWFIETMARKPLIVKAG